jgi:hypothetical protein
MEGGFEALTNGRRWVRDFLDMTATLSIPLIRRLLHKSIKQKSEMLRQAQHDECGSFWGVILEEPKVTKDLEALYKTRGEILRFALE